MKRTNWEQYYSSPVPTAFFSRAIIRGHLLRMIRKTGLPGAFSIAELGGGGSCFYGKIRKKFKTENYTIYDSCMAGLQAFLRKNPNGKTVQTDLLSFQTDCKYDLVFSVGLIEHFPPEKTECMIKKHFEMTKPGGYVILFTPTPSLIYRVTRKAAEITGLWQFPDERPIPPDELRNTADKYGTFLEGYTIHSNFLSQYAALYRKKQDENTENL